MNKFWIVLLPLLLLGCNIPTTNVQKQVLELCLNKCTDGNTECINACGNLLKGDCK
jgi:hypothetical protein